jgi:ubiquinone/menaquinone biosynthesis C-methylase UbiE
MPENVSVEDRKRRMALHFDAIAEHYEKLGFVHVSARRLIELSDLQTGTRVLDVGTGTGLVALAASNLVGRTGRVVGVDFSSEMLVQARANATSADLERIEFVQGDAEHLEFADSSFDVALFASSLFFMPDMSKAILEAYRVLVPGGLIGFSSFGSTFMSPLSGLLTARLEAHGVAPANPPVARLADPEVCRKLLEAAGFGHVQVVQEQLGYFYKTIEDRWTEITAGLEGMPLLKLASEVREQLKDEHFAELKTLETPDGLWLNVPANFAFGRKPTSK